MPLKSKQNTAKRKPKLSTILDQYSSASIKRYLRNKELTKEMDSELELSPLTNKAARKKTGASRDNSKARKIIKEDVMSKYKRKTKKR
jgi:hypothetical protein